MLRDRLDDATMHGFDVTSMQNVGLACGVSQTDPMGWCAGPDEGLAMIRLQNSRGK